MNILQLTFLLKTKIFRHLNLNLAVIKIWFLNRRGFKTIKSAYDILLSMNPGDRTFEFYVAGSYGNFYSDRLRQIKSEFIFLDIGANQGLYTLIAAQNPFNITSYAFEPAPDAFDLLSLNVSLNKLDSNCVLVKKAIFKETSTAIISIPDGHSGAATISSKNELTEDQNIKKIEIETISGDDLSDIIDDKNIPIVVKIDVEGADLEVIEQIVNSSLKDRIIEVYYEVDEEWTDPEEFETLLRSIGLSNFKKNGSGTHYDVLAT